MRKLVLILAILVITVAFSGCTSNQTPPNNKTYSTNGLSFSYPGNWEEMDKTPYQNFLGDNGELLVLVGNEADSAFGIAKINRKNQINTLDDLIAFYNSTLKNNSAEYISEGPMTIDGVQAYEITVNSPQGYLLSVLFIKNNTCYLAAFRSPDNNQQTFDQILNSLKIS
jgi:hypothetical protein